MKKKYLKHSLIAGIVLSLVVSFYSCSNTTPQVKIPKVKNIILLIGDGMGLAQVYAAMSVTDHPLNLERAQYIGLSKTYSIDNYTTDSGAGGTAISTGTKTKNHAIAVDSSGNKLKTILEYSEDAGKSTGIVVTCNLTHATPAAFVAHEPSRYMENEIAKDYLDDNVDVLIGGGAHIFDSLGVSSELASKGYQVKYHLDSVEITKPGNFVCFAAEDQLPKILDGRGDYLCEAVGMALKKLNQNDGGFFLMVEGSQIDWGGHANDLDYVNTELVDFDKAVGLAMDFAGKNPGTLVVVTADHETGGLSLPNGNINKKEVTGLFATTGHTGIMVPIYAYGTGAEAFSGIMENTGIFTRMLKAFGFKK